MARRKGHDDPRRGGAVQRFVDEGNRNRKVIRKAPLRQIAEQGEARQCLAVVKPVAPTVRAPLQHREERTESKLGIECSVVLPELDMDVIVLVPGDRDGTEKRMEDPERHLKAADRYGPVI